MSKPFETLEHGDWIIEISKAVGTAAAAGAGEGGAAGGPSSFYYRCSWKRKPESSMETLGGARCIVAKSRATVEIMGKCSLEAVCAYLDGITTTTTR